jgi:hypothetical protein
LPRQPKDIPFVTQPAAGAPGYPPYGGGPGTPAVDRWFSSERFLGQVVSLLVALVACWAIFLTVSDWHSYQVVKRYVADPARDLSEAERADLMATIGAVGYAVFLLAAAVCFVLWLWRVRWNSELFCRAEHRRGRGWVIASWFCPGVNLWFPRQLVEDVMVASDPATPARTESLDGLPKPAIVWGWWAPWLVAAVIDLFVRVLLAGDDSTGELLGVAVLATVSAAALAASAGFLVLIIRQVDEWQAARPWTPWWAAG